MTAFRLGVASLFALALISGAADRVRSAPANDWSTIAKTLQTSDNFANGYHRFNFPRRDIMLHLGDITVAPELALGAWVGFSDDQEHSMMMGDLIVTPSELGPLLAEIARQGLDVTAIHNHLVGEDPRLTYVHVHGMGPAADLATKVDHVLALTATPRPVLAPAPIPLTIDTTTVFQTLGRSGKARGAVAQLSFGLVPGRVTMDGETVTPALGYASPVNIQMVSAGRAVATGDFAVPGDKVGPLLHTLAEHKIVATALHTHMIGESPKIYFIHFWADGPLSDVLAGLKAAVDSAR